MEEGSAARYVAWRYWLVVGALSLAAIGIYWRLIELTVLDRAFLQTQGAMRSTRVLKIPAYRGIIADRNGRPLAVSTPVLAVWINPKEFSATSKQLANLAALLKISPKTISTRAKQNSSREFLYLHRQMDPRRAPAIEALNIPGVYLQREYRRYYPEGEAMAQLVGLTNVDDKGQEGIELLYDAWLQGIPGERRVIKDRYGHVVVDLGILRETHAGHNLWLSVDRRIQYLAYRELKIAMARTQAQSGSVVVLNPKTGEVLAIANQPSYNPNERPGLHDGRFRNRAVTDVFEPGSTMKPFSIAVVLSKTRATPHTMVDTAPGSYAIGTKWVRDVHAHGWISVSDVLKYSSNVGVSKLVLSLPVPGALRQALSEVGFGQRTTSNFPGESMGELPAPPRWHAFSLATLSFGYGLSVTALQLASAYAVFANEGIKMPVTLVRRDNTPIGETVLPSKVVKQVTEMMERIVSSDDAVPQARVPGYRVAGKTGTARMIGPRGYQQNSHRALFVGFAPASRPALVVVVQLSDLKGPRYYGAQIAAPVFAQVMAGSLRILDIPPDQRAEDRGQKTEGGR